MTLRFIDPKVHAVLDYAVAATLVTAPFVPGLFEGSAAAFWISIAAGLSLLLYSLVTSYSADARKKISYSVHLMLDFGAAVGLLVMPLAFGFGGVPRTLFWVIGAAVIAVVFTSKTEGGSAATAANPDPRRA